MKIIKPNWVKHEHKGIPLSIFSIDIHPDGTRFATGGQGNDCGRVAIWNLSAVISITAENDENQPKLLCQIDSHLQCVNSVRWSHQGNYLASAGDDKLIMIWQLGGRYGHTEQYRTVSTLRIHSGDILDLSWSHDDQYLASCSIDNMIVVWNAQRWPEIVKIIKGHCGLVKGVTWDPIGKYLASQSADKTLRIWRISDWSEEVCIKEPFEQCGDTTHVLRLSWSPEGQYLVSAQAMNNCGSVSKIIERHDWSFIRDFVGHRKAIPCARFNPNMFKYYPKSKKKKNQNDNEMNNNVDAKDGQQQSKQKFKTHTICALGSRDRSISIWSTAKQRPLVVIDDVFGNSVVDLSWSYSGYQLLACSVDGGVICFQFDSKELGTIYDQDERVQFLQQLYGNSLFSQTNSIGNRLIEDIDILLLQQQKQENNDNTNNTLQNGSLPSTNASNGPMKQIENSNNNDNNQNESSQKKSVNNNTPTKSSTASVNDSKDQQQPKSSNVNHSPGRLAKGPTDKQIEIRSADGRRRIIPLFIPPTTSPPTAAPDSSGNSDTANSNANDQKSSINSLSSRPMTFSSSSESKSKIVIETLDESNPATNLSEAYQYLNNNNSFNGFGKSSNDSNLTTTNNKTPNSATTTTVNGESEIAGDNKNQMSNQNNKTQSSDESSDDEIIIRRSKTLKRSSSKTLPNELIKRKISKSSSTTSASINSTTTTTLTANQTKSNLSSNNNVTNVQSSETNNNNKSSSSMIDTDKQTQPHHHQPTNFTYQISMTSTNGQQSNLFFPPLRLPRQNHSSIRLFNTSEDGKQFSVSIEYPLSSSGICKLSAYIQEDYQWSIIVSDPILAIAGNEDMIACFCQDHSIQVFYTKDGRRLFVPIILDSPVSRMTCTNNYHLLLITIDARLWLWNFSQSKVLVRGESLASLLIDPKTNKQLSIQGASVSPTSKPVVTISNGRTYVYESDFQTWCLLNDLNDPLNSSTDLRPCAVNQIKQLSSYSKFPSRSIMNFFASNVPIAQQSAMNFMEKQLEVSKLIGSSNEYRYWIINLIKQLVSMHKSNDMNNVQMMKNIENRIKFICTNLISASFSLQQQSSSPSSSNMIVGYKKHELLREILSILATNLSLQRLYLEFKDLLDSFNENETALKNPFAQSKTNIEKIESTPPAANTDVDMLHDNDDNNIDHNVNDKKLT